MIYANQIISNPISIKADSIQSLASTLLDTIANNNSSALFSLLKKPPTNSIYTQQTIFHFLVPAMLECRNSEKQIDKLPLGRRIQFIIESVQKQLPTYLKKYSSNSTSPSSSSFSLYQCLLLDPNLLLLSSNQILDNRVLWPNFKFKGGIIPIAPDEQSPNSAYRKLEEALQLFGLTQHNFHYIIDLACSPGGFVRVHEKYFLSNPSFQQLICVDRSPLDSKLFDRIRNKTQFIQGDVFKILKKIQKKEILTLLPIDLVSCDVAAFPEKVEECILEWMQANAARHMIFTLKWKGEEPDWNIIQRLRSKSLEFGYHCRLKHLQHNRNEICFYAYHPTL